jgi:glycosyltransferase involved in cell wall biosynthesis
VTFDCSVTGSSRLRHGGAVGDPDALERAVELRRALRFCMVTTFYPPYNFGGDGIAVQRLCNELAYRGHRVDVIHCIDSYRFAAPLPSEPYRDHPNVTVHGLKSPLGFLSPLATNQTGFPVLKSARIRSILSTRFDVIHFHNVSLVGGPKVLEMGDAIKLYTMHDYWLVCPTHALFRFNRAPCTKAAFCSLCTLSYKRPPQWWRHFGLMKAAIGNVDAFITPTVTGQRKHEQMGLRGRIVHIPNFVSFGESASTDDDADAGEGPFFLFVGRLERLKGLHTVLPLFERYATAQLWIAGTGTEEAELRRLAARSPNVRFLGQQSGARLQQLYRRAVAVIYPAINYQTGVAPSGEGLGAPLVIMEAFSQKTPVIVSSFGRIPGLVTRLGAGLVYSTGEELITAMDRLLAEPSQRRELGLAGYEAYRQNWTSDAYLKRYFALIDDIAAARRSSRSTGMAELASAAQGGGNASAGELQECDSGPACKTRK